MTNYFYHISPRYDTSNPILLHMKMKSKFVGCRFHDWLALTA